MARDSQDSLSSSDSENASTPFTGRTFVNAPLVSTNLGCECSRFRIKILFTKLLVIISYLHEIGHLGQVFGASEFLYVATCTLVGKCTSLSFWLNWLLNTIDKFCLHAGLAKCFAPKNSYTLKFWVFKLDFS